LKTKPQILGALSKGRLTHYSDRAVAVIGSTLLDNALKVAIQTRFINLKLADVAQIFDGFEWWSTLVAVGESQNRICTRHRERNQAG
jgi:hypothetical protein